MSESDYKPFPWWRLIIYDTLLWILNVTFDCFFREIRSRGAFKIPKTGPVIFVGAPHANQFVDPIILMNQVKSTSGRRISFLIAAKSYRLKIIGMMSKCQLSIPVERPQDNLMSANGKIFVDFKKDSCLVTGQSTFFTQFLEPKCLIALPKSLGASEVLEVIDDEHLRIRKPFKDSEKIVKLLKDGTPYKFAHKIDQNKVYQQVFNHLNNNNCIGIFPEGGSHDRTDLLPIKAGVAIMALGAMANFPDCNVQIVPCGMNYFNAHKFRSRAVIEYGNPISISKDLVQRYKNPDTNKDAVKELLEIITNGLKACTVTCDSFETLMVVQAARRLYANHFAARLPLPLVIEMNRRLVYGYKTFEHEPKVQAIKSKILNYNTKLDQIHLPDHLLENFNEKSKLRSLGILSYRFVKLLILFVLALPGAVLFSPVFLIAKIISTRKQKAALAGSVVKIKGNDVVATWKILVSLVIAPIFYSFYATIGVFVTRNYLTFQIGNIKLWILLYCFNVLITYSALLAGEQGLDIFKSLRPLYLSLIDGSSIKELKDLRSELTDEITDIVDEFGWKLFPEDFNLLESNDEEEDLITMKLKNRRKQRKESSGGVSTSNSSSSLSSQFSNSSSVSDGVSLLNSDNSLTNIPMFSDYSLHENKDAVLTPKADSDDYAISRASSQLELNFGHKRHPSDLHQKLSDKIKLKMRGKFEEKDKTD